MTCIKDIFAKVKDLKFRIFKEVDIHILNNLVP